MMPPYRLPCETLRGCSSTSAHHLTPEPLVQPHRYAQRMFTLLSLEGTAGLSMAEQAYRLQLTEGGAEDPIFEKLLTAPPRTPTFVRLQRQLVARFRVEMR
jgi:hypothetical protein